MQVVDEYKVCVCYHEGDLYIRRSKGNTARWAEYRHRAVTEFISEIDFSKEQDLERLWRVTVYGEVRDDDTKRHSGATNPEAKVIFAGKDIPQKDIYTTFVEESEQGVHSNSPRGQKE